MPSDTPSPGPRTLPWEEYEQLGCEAVARAFALRGKMTGALADELCALFGDDVGYRLCSMLATPPLMCPDCGGLFRSAVPRVRCHVCQAQVDEAATVTGAVAGVLARLPPDLAAKVRAELAQKGGS